VPAGEPAGTPGGPYDQAGADAPGVQATTVAATTPPPASTAPRRNPRRLRSTVGVGDGEVLIWGMAGPSGDSSLIIVRW
jgi:hypothetical protein